MADVIFVAVLCVFFALCVVYVGWCDRIIGPDVTPPPAGTGDRDVDADRNAPAVGASA
jgi:hypothetical protein